MKAPVWCPEPKTRASTRRDLVRQRRDNGFAG